MFNLIEIVKIFKYHIVSTSNLVGSISNGISLMILLLPLIVSRFLMSKSFMVFPRRWSKDSTCMTSHFLSRSSSHNLLIQEQNDWNSEGIFYAQQTDLFMLFWQGISVIADESHNKKKDFVICQTTNICWHLSKCGTSF